jgi:hypothetical protein
MNRSKFLALSAAALLVGAAGCSQYSDGKPVRVVRNATEVASCQKVVDVKVSARLAQTEVLAEAANQARDKGADTLLLPEGASTGEAYRCGAPNVATKQ